MYQLQRQTQRPTERKTQKSNRVVSNYHRYADDSSGLTVPAPATLPTAEVPAVPTLAAPDYSESSTYQRELLVKR